MIARRCPYCNQPLPELRLGVKLTPLKSKIFDLVQRGGGDGILMADLYSIICADNEGGRYNWRATQFKPATLKAHIHQINEIIAARGYRIYGRGGIVRLIRTRRKTIIDKLATS